MRTIEFEGTTHEFPDGTTDDVVAQVLRKYNAGPTTSDVIGAIPGEAKRQMVEAVSGAVKLGADVGVLSQEMGDTSAAVRKEVEAERQIETPKKMNLWQEGLYSGGASVLGQGPAMVAGALAAPFLGTPAATAYLAARGATAAGTVAGAVTTAMGATTGLQKYGETRDAGFGPTRSGLHALFHGLVEKYTEYLPLKDLVGKPIRSAIYSFLWKEATGEQIATLLQDFNDKISTRPEMTLGDYLHDAAVTAIAVGVSAPVQAGAIRTLSAAVAPFIKPESMTPEQKSVIDAANAKAGNDLGLFAPQPTAPIGAVQPQPPMLDISALPQPPAIKAGTERVYTVIPAEGQIQPMLVWTNDLAKVQQMVSVMGSDVTIPYIDMTPAALKESQQDEMVQTIRAEQQVSPEGEYVLPSNYMTSGNTLYTPPQVPVPQPAAETPPTPVGSAEGNLAAPPITQTVGPTPTPQQPAKPRGEPTLIWRNDEKGVKIRVVFPDETSKQLYLYHKHLTEGAADYASQNQLATERETLAQALGIPANFVAEYAKWYNASISSNLGAMAQNGTMRPPAFNIREYQEQRELLESPTVRRWRELAKAAEAGTVQIAPDLPQSPYVKRSQAFLQKWLQLFTPGAKMVIADIVMEGKNVASVRRVDGVTMVRIPSISATKFWATFALAHEFGHHIFLEVGNKEEHAQAMAELRMEWEVLKAQVPGWTVEEFIDRWMAPSKMVYKRHVYETLGVKPSDPAGLLAQAIDAKRTPGDALSFDEYVAEQFARYVLKHHRVTISDQLRDFFKEAVNEVRAFFDKIVYKISPQKRFEQFIDSLRTVPPTQAVYDAAKMNILAEDSYFDTVDEAHDFTTRVLARLPKKDKINRITIIGELARPDVKDQERKLFNQVLDTFDGDVIDRSDLNSRVMEKIIPIDVRAVSDFAGYGLSRIGVDGVMSYPKTIIFDLPFDISKANHFDDPKYFGHARWFEWHGTEQGEYGRVRSIVELQSDLAQKDRTVHSLEELNTKIISEEESIAFNNKQLLKLRTVLQDPFKLHAPKNQFDTVHYEYRGELFHTIPDEKYQKWIEDGLLKHLPNLRTFSTYIDPSVHQEVKDYLLNDITGLEVRSAELEARLQNLIERRDANVVGKIESLPKRWWEFMLRKLNHDASVDGVAKMRMASADTVAKVEGWPKQRFTSLGDGNFQDEEGATYTHDQVKELERTGNVYGRMQGIYNRYANEITKFVKREFGAKEIVDDQGQYGPPIVRTVQPTSWLEWDVKPNLQNVPIEYYDLVDSMNNASESVGKLMQDTVAEDVPAIPGYFEKFQGFFQNSLQLNQIAKLLPHVQPLQVYRRLMQSMSNLKNTLMAGPNQRIKEWYSLSKKDSIGVQDMLRSEVADGQHWTKLEKHQVVVGGKPMDMWIHVATERVAAEAKARGLTDKAINVYLGVKNDFLTTLGTMEQTLNNSIMEYFRQNPVAGSARQAVVRAQFQQFRESPWMPDRRFGQWSVVVRAREAMVIDGQEVKKNEKVYFSGHRRQRFQKAEYARLVREYGDKYAVTMEYVEDLPYVMRSLPREFIRMLPEQLQLTPEQMARFEELYYDVTKEGRYYKLFTREKKGIGGAEQDVRQSYSDYMWRTANLISKMAYGRKLQRETYALNRLTNAAAKNGGSVVALRRLHEYMVKNQDYVMRPQHEWEQLRAIVSLWYLWGVPKTALMNATTIVTTTYPRLAAIGGDLRATREIIRAMKDVSLHWKNPTKVSNEVAALFAQGRADGVTNQSFAAELAAVADGNAIERIMPTYAFMRDSGVKDRVRKYTWKMIHWGMMPFRVTEEFNRRVTLLAAYRMERIAGKPGLEHGTGDGSAYLAARDTVDFTQNEYAPWNRAKFLQGKKSVALIFFSFMQNMSFFMFGGDKGWWRGLLILAALSGLQGLPGAENIIDFLNWLGRKTLGEPLDLRVEAREMATAIGVSPDYVMHGAMHSMFGLGWDTANSLGMGRIIPGTDAVFGQGDANQRIMQMAGEIGGPFGSLSVAVLQALFDDNPNMLLRFDRALPPLVRNIERGYRGATDNQWTDSKGRALVDEASGLEVLGQLAGFSPTTKTSAQEMLHTQREQAQFYVLRRQNLMSALFQATQAGDTDAIADAKESIRDYNGEVPDAQLRITGKEMQQSLRARARSAQEVLTGEAATKRYAPLYKRVADSFSEPR